MKKLNYSSTKILDILKKLLSMEDIKKLMTNLKTWS
jgi:hypothetical protein